MQDVREFYCFPVLRDKQRSSMTLRALHANSHTRRVYLPR